MQLLRLPAWVYLVVAAVPALLIGFFAAALGPNAEGLAFLFIVAWAFAFALLHWHRIDESSREAHKFAFFWGAGFGLVLAVFAVPLAGSTPAAGDLLDRIVAASYPRLPEGRAGFTIGVIFTAVAQMVGWMVVWAAWWMTKKRA